MEIQLEDIGPCRKRMSVTVSSERVKSEIDKAFRYVNQKARMKGFRPGKIPRKVLEATMGDEILAQAKESLIEETFREALQEKTLSPLGTPKVDVAEAKLEGDKELSFSVEMDLKPEVRVGSLESLEVRRKPTEVTEEEIGKALEKLAEGKRKLEPTEEPIEEGDFAKVDLSYKLGDSEVVQKKGLQINPRIPIRGTDPEEFAAKLTGMRVGEKAILPIEYPDTFELESARGKEGEVEISIQGVLRFQAPPIDDDLARSFGKENLRLLEDMLLENMKEEKERMEDSRVEEESLDSLFAENPFDIPEGLLASEVEERLRRIQEDMKERRMPEQQIEEQIKALKPEVEENARIGIRNLFMIEAIAKKEKLFVTETDVENHLKKIASANNTTLQEARAYAEKNHLFGEIRFELMDRKVREFLRDAVKISDS